MGKVLYDGAEEHFSKHPPSRVKISTATNGGEAGKGDTDDTNAGTKNATRSKSANASTYGGAAGKTSYGKGAKK